MRANDNHPGYSPGKSQVLTAGDTLYESDAVDLLTPRCGSGRSQAVPEIRGPILVAVLGKSEARDSSEAIW